MNKKSCNFYDLVKVAGVGGKRYNCMKRVVKEGADKRWSKMVGASNPVPF